MKLKKYIGILLVLAVLLNGCGGAGKEMATQSAESSSKETTIAEEGKSEDSDNSSAESSKDDDTNPDGTKPKVSASDSEHGVFPNMDIDKNTLAEYKALVRNKITEDYSYYDNAKDKLINYKEDEIVKEYYGSFDPDDSNSDRALVFLGKDRPMAMFYIAFVDGEAEVLDVWQYNFSTMRGFQPTSAIINGVMGFFPVVLDTSLVHIANNDSDMVCIRVQKSGYGKESFVLLRVTENYLEQYVDETETSADSSAELIDTDGDGVFDQYSAEYLSELHTFWYPLYVTYDLMKDGPVIKVGKIDFGLIPVTPEKVVSQYMEACVLKEYYHPIKGADGIEKIIDERLAALSDFPYDEHYNWNVQYVENTYLTFGDYLEEMPEGYFVDGFGAYINIEATVVDGDNAIVNAKMVGDFDPKEVGNFGEGKGIEYTLEKKNGGWIITSQKEVESASMEASEELYRPLFLPTTKRVDKGNLQLGLEELYKWDVSLVTDVINHTEDHIACHIYVENMPEIVPEQMRVDWYVLEINGDIYVAEFSDYLDTSLSEEELYNKMIYFGGENNFNQTIEEYGISVKNCLIDGNSFFTLVDSSSDPKVSVIVDWTKQGFSRCTYVEEFADGTMQDMELYNESFE